MILEKVKSTVEKNASLALIIKCINRIKNRDNKYIDFALKEYHDPKCLRVISFGNKNKGKIVYSIQEQGQGYGFFAEFRALMCNLLFAEEMGFIPHVIWGKNHLYYEENGINGNYNAFEYYFEPINIDEYFESKNIIISTSLQNAYIEEQYGVNGYQSSNVFEEALVEIMKKYISIKKELRLEFDKEISKLFEGKRVIGVHHRGTDYKQEYNGHPVSIAVEQEICRVVELKEIYKIDKIFLATDDAHVLKGYQREFGDDLIYYNDIYRGDTLESVAFSQNERDNHHYLLGKEVLRDVYTLSKCKCLVAGKSQVSFFAQIFNKCNARKYECVEIIDSGLNSNKKYFKAKNN